MLALLSGCGGGGGGTGSGGTISYATDWSRAVSGGGASQLISLYNSNLILLEQRILNKTDGSTVNFSGLSTAQGYTIVATLYPNADANGLALGNVVQNFTGASGTTMKTEVGSTVASVKVDPPSASFSKEYSKQFTAQAIALSGTPTFALNSQFSWSTIGSVASVNTTGLALGTATGAGAVRATYTPNGASGSSSINVTPFTPRRTKWTVLVYMAAVNNLDKFSELNMNQMEQITNNDVRFVVQWKLDATNPSGSIGYTPLFSSTRRYEVKPDTTNQINSTLVRDMGDTDSGKASTIKDFLDWAVPLYPSDRYCLVVWDHGSGWKDPSRAFAEDDVKGSWIQTWEIGQALQGHHFDILAWDCSLQQMAEVAYECKDYADYVVGSEESPPGAGYPYHMVFQPFASNPDDTTRNLTKGFVDGMINNYGNSGKITQSVLESSKLPALASAVNTLATDLIANASGFGSAITGTRNTVQGYNVNSTRYYQDLRAIVQKLPTMAGVPTSTINACNAVDTAIANAVVWEGHNTLSSGSRGVSIDNSPGSVFSPAATDYAKLKWATDSKWGNWLLASP